jgi:arylsulfatase A-like enzyme
LTIIQAPIAGKFMNAKNYGGDSMSRPNFLVIYCDQLRQDFLGCYGNQQSRTPNIDRLAKEGVVFENHYAANTVCMPSRATFFTGQHVESHGVLCNGIPLRECEPTLPGVLAENGYRTASFGKIHLSPTESSIESGCAESVALWESRKLAGWNGPYYGFEHVEFTHRHGEGAICAGGHYGDWVKKNFDVDSWQLGPDSAQGPQVSKLSCWRSNLPVEAHHSTWTAERTIEWLNNIGDESFFAYCSFPDPHHPWVAPRAYGEKFDPDQMPLLPRRAEENSGKPANWRRGVYLERMEGVTDENLRIGMAQYHAAINLIDDCVGKVLAALEKSGKAENTIVLFTADHGEFLGEHGLVYKGPCPCRSLLLLPMIARVPGGESGRNAGVWSNVDVMPTLLDMAGVESPCTLQGRSWRAALENPQADAGDGVAYASGWDGDSNYLSIVSDRWRITWYPKVNEGELYDLERDPGEQVNLFNDPGFAAERERLLNDLLRRAANSGPYRTPRIARW